jgi:hypothetical protein
MTVRGAFAVSDASFTTGYAFTVGGAFAGDMTIGSEVVAGDDATMPRGMIVAVDYDVAQELANLSGADCKTKYGSAGDNVVVDGQSYVCSEPPGHTS